MKFFVKLLLKAGVTLGVLFVAYQYMLPGIMSGGSNIPGMSIPGMSDSASDGPKGLGEIGNAVVDKDVTVYQWTDESGTTHFGSTPPTGQGAYEKKEIRANTNVVQAHKAAEEKEEETEQRSRIARVGSAYSPEKVKDIFDDTKDLQKQLNDRTADQDKMLKELMGQ